MRFLLFFLLLCNVSFSQNWNTTPMQGGKTTLSYFGSLKADSGLLIPKVNSLTWYHFKDSVGAIVSYQDSLYYRSILGWQNISRSFSGNTIYTGDGTLNGDRVIDCDGNSLQLINGNFAIGNLFFSPYTSAKKIVRTPTPILSNQYMPMSVNSNYADLTGNIIDTGYKPYVDSVVAASTPILNLQDALDNGATLNKDNTVNVAGNSLTFDSINYFTANSIGDYTINSNGFIFYNSVFGNNFQGSRMNGQYDLSLMNGDAGIFADGSFYVFDSATLQATLTSNGNGDFIVRNKSTSSNTLQLDPTQFKVIKSAIPIKYGLKWIMKYDSVNDQIYRDTISSSGGSQNLQQVTDIDSVTTHQIKIGSKLVITTPNGYTQTINGETNTLTNDENLDLPQGSGTLTLAVNGQIADSEGKIVIPALIPSDSIAGGYYPYSSNPKGYLTTAVTNVSALTLGTSGTDLSSTVANSTTTPVITLNVPTASASNRGALSSTDWSTFNNKQAALTRPVTATNGNLVTGYLTKVVGSTGVDSSGIYASGGLFGIGTNSPQAVLHTLGSSTGAVRNRIENTNSAGFADFSLFNNSSALSCQMIGTTEATTGAAGYGRIRTSSGANGLILDAGGSKPLSLQTNDADRIVVSSTGVVNIGTTTYIGSTSTTPTAILHLKAGTASANTPPLKFTSGTNLTTPENGSVEYDGTDYFATANSTRYTIDKTLRASATLDFASTAASTSTDLTITVTGAALNDIVSFGVPNGSVNANSCFTAWVSATNTVTIRFNNYQTVGAIDPASGTFKVSVIK